MHCGVRCGVCLLQQGLVFAPYACELSFCALWCALWRVSLCSEGERLEALEEDEKHHDALGAMQISDPVIRTAMLNAGETRCEHCTSCA